VPTVPVLLSPIISSYFLGATGSACAPCKPDLCAFVQCAVPELTARDECGCCERCLGAEGERCGGTQGARCGPGLVCVSQRQAEAPEVDADAEEGTGRCVCKEDGAVCGSDGRSYSSVCALHLHSWRAVLDGRERVRKAHDGECKLAPAIVVPPKRIHNVTGAQVYLSCEVKAVPTPIITWKKVTESPKGVRLLEELPGDRVNMAVQVRGGPSKHESTGWVLVSMSEGQFVVGQLLGHGTIFMCRISFLWRMIPQDCMSSVSVIKPSDLWCKSQIYLFVKFIHLPHRGASLHYNNNEEETKRSVNIKVAK
uniref:Insulin like growth factor binding protein like 1 n=1 Tax=Pseudonaja textilis TaxID=8673 RepID=A0A670YDN1_PSETE